MAEGDSNAEMLINSNRAISDEYSRLAILGRVIRRAIESGGVICMNCGRRQDAHIGISEACNVSVCSLSFRSDAASELIDVNRALSLIEDLRMIDQVSEY